MKFFISSLFLALSLLGCAGKNSPETDKTYVLSSELGDTKYAFYGGNLYENGAILGPYETRGDAKLAILDGNGANLDKNAKLIKLYFFERRYGAIYAVSHKNGVCAEYNKGNFVDFQILFNIFQSKEWFNYSGGISLGSERLKELSSARMAKFNGAKLGAADEKMRREYQKARREAILYFQLNANDMRELIFKKLCE